MEEKKPTNEGLGTYIIPSSLGIPQTCIFYIGSAQEVLGNVLMYEDMTAHDFSFHHFRR